MSRYTITPWRTQHDLLQVRAQLFTPEATTDAQRIAISRIMAWKLRGNLPHAVESTALLIDAQLHHSGSTSESTTTSTFSIRAVYSAAFTRFVTGFCDIGRNRQRSLEPSSMLAIARQIGMPDEFVALRHEATHEELPSLRRLIGATHEALGWLWQAYWGRLDEVEDAEVALPVFRREAGELLKAFRRGRRDALRAGLGKGEQDYESRRVGDEVVAQCGDSAARVKALTGALVEDRLILPATRETGSSLDGAYLIWDGVLVDLCDRLLGFRQSLMTTLLAAIGAHTTAVPVHDAYKEALSMWVLHIMLAESFGQDARQKQQAEVMKWCCLYPGHWSEYIGKQLLQSGSVDLREDWDELFEASLVNHVLPKSPHRSNSDEHESERLAGNDNREVERGAGSADVGTYPGETKSWHRAIGAATMPIGLVA